MSSSMNISHTAICCYRYFASFVAKRLYRQKHFYFIFLFARTFSSEIFIEPFAFKYGHFRQYISSY